MNMFPFSLRGPEFLVAYAALSTIVLFLAWWIQRFLEFGSATDDRAWGTGVAKDPYQIAGLRGGRDEVIRVAVVSLVERGLLKAEGENLEAVALDAADRVRRPLDKAVLTRFAGREKGQGVFSDRVVRDEADAVIALLQDKGLLPDARTEIARVITSIASVGFLWAVAGVKVAVAISRGRHNVLFLLIMAVGVAIVAAALVKRRRTALGNRVLSYLRGQFAALAARRDSLRLDGRTGETVFMAAAFGMAALPIALGSVFEPLCLRPLKPQSGGSGWGPFSSCSSCSSGSSCGGGGCGSGCGGGGCGGCGGCG